MIDPKDFSKSRPVIKPDDLNGANTAVVTVRKCEEIELGGDKKIVMQFDEFPDTTSNKPDEYMNYFPNLTSIRNLVDGLGSNEKQYIGEKIVLEVVKTNDPVKKRQVSALWIASADTWDDHFKHIAKRNRSSSNGDSEPATQSARKSGGKKTTARR